MSALPAVAVAVSGAVGAIGRWLLLQSLHDSRLGGVPLGLLGVNAAGCLVAGFLFVLIEERVLLPPMWREALLIGALGAFTTFSGFTVELWQLLQDAGWGTALWHLLISVALCSVATLVGIGLAGSIG